jgi:hypothetical protein
MERQNERLKRTLWVHMIWNVGHGIGQHLLISDADRCHDRRDGSRFYARRTETEQLMEPVAHRHSQLCLFNMQ